MRRCVAVIGGGITGLAAANRFMELDPSAEVVLLEGGDRLGGVLNTTREDGFLFEDAADSFLTSPSTAVDLCHRVGLGTDLMGTEETCRQALVLSRGRLLPIPLGFHLMAPSRYWPLLASPILSWRGKLRAGCEWMLPGKQADTDESLQSFVCRRFGRELFERLVQPLVGGIYTGDPERLSIEATFPRFRQMEREHGSLSRAMLRSRDVQGKQESRGARYGQFATLRGGMSTLVDALAERLPPDAVHLASPVTTIVPTQGGRWLLAIDGSVPKTVEVDGVVVAVPMHHGARLAENIDQSLAAELRGIPYASCVVVGLGYRREQIAHPLNGFGFVVPLLEQRTILSCSFSSVKFAGRADGDAVLLRVFIGGDCQSGLLRLSRDELAQLAQAELAEVLSIRGEPIFRRIVRHSRAMPQYHVGHLDRVARTEERLRRFPSLAFAGNALHGVGVPACIQSGEAAAERIAQQIKPAGPSPSGKREWQLT